MYIKKKGDSYLVANAAKGGVTKLFSIDKKKQLTSDSGIIGKTKDGTIVTSQWIDQDYSFDTSDNGFIVEGNMHKVPAGKLFTPIKLIIFRIFLLLFGWNSKMAYYIKGLIRRLLMLNSGDAPLTFRRKVRIDETHLHIRDTITLQGSAKMESLQLGDGFYVRYVPQSRYFQSQDRCQGLTTSQVGLDPAFFRRVTGGQNAVGIIQLVVLQHNIVHCNCAVPANDTKDIVSFGQIHVNGQVFKSDS